MMQQRNGHLPGMEWLAMDATDMSRFEDGSFDIVIDKATADAVICMEKGEQQVETMLKEACRVLRPKGVFVLVSAQPKVQQLAQEEALDWKGGSLDKT